VIKKDMGRSTYYNLNLTLPEEKTINNWLQFVKKRLPYIPDEFLLT